MKTLIHWLKQPFWNQAIPTCPRYSEPIMSISITMSFDRLIVLLYASYSYCTCVTIDPLNRISKYLWKSVSEIYVSDLGNKEKWWEMSNVVVEKWMTSGTAILRILSNCCSCFTIYCSKTLYFNWQRHSRAICMIKLQYSQLACTIMFFFCSDKKETVELDKKHEKPDLNDVMNVVAAKIPDEWQTVSITIYMYM